MSVELCEELILEIFTRLPTKSLLRFRSVSKSLYACISSPKFVRSHTFRSPNKVMILHQLFEFEGEQCNKEMYTIHSRGQLSYNNPYIDIPIVEYPFLNFCIVGSCDGILCLYKYGYGFNLWNPSIRRKVTIHDRPSWSDSEGLWCPMGFGFDPIIDDYKILMRTISATDTKRVFDPSTFVYTMKTDTWREIASPTSAYTFMSPQCLFDGSFHWTMKWYLPDSHSHEDYISYMLAFDLSSEVFSRIELPEPSWETNQVTAIKGRLSVISSKDDDTCIWLRECNNNAASWSIAFKLNTHEFEGAQRVFQLTLNGDLIFNPFQSGIIIYNPATGSRLNFVRLIGSLSMLRMTPCIESLKLLDMGTSCDQGNQITRQTKRSRRG